MNILFEAENAEQLVAISRLSLHCVDRMISAMPPEDALQPGEVGALVRLISGALDYGLDAERASNGPPGGA